MSYKKGDEMIKVVKSRRMFLGAEEPLLENHGVIVEDNGIKTVTRAEAAFPSEAEVIDLGDRTLLPGLIDCHVHAGFDGSPNHENTLLELFPFQVLKASLNMKKDLEAGFTTLRCMGDKGYLDIGLKQAIDAGVIPGPRLRVSGHAISITGGHADMDLPPDVTVYEGYGIIADGPEEVRKAARQQIKYGADIIKLMATGGVLSGADEPGSQQLSLEEMKVAVEEARKAEKKVAAHAQGNAGIKDAIRAGVDSIEHGFFLDEEAIEMMLANNVYLCPVQQALQRLVERGGKGSGLPDYAYRKAKLVEVASVASLKMAMEAGVKIVIGTDVGSSLNPHGDNAVELDWMVRHGMSPQQALIGATSLAAELLGMADQVGTIKSGMFADLIAVKGNPLEDINVLKEVDFVMKDGEIIKWEEE